MSPFGMALINKVSILLRICCRNSNYTVACLRIEDRTELTHIEINAEFIEHLIHKEIDSNSRNVFKLVNLLQENDLPHNITVSRGSSFHTKSPGSLRDHVRVYVWARKPVGPCRDIYKFVGPALCELFGHLMIKTQENYDSLTEDYVNSVLLDQTEEPFQSVLEKVRDIFQET